MDLWQYEIRPIKHTTGPILLRAKHRATNKFDDYDISGTAEDIWGHKGLLAKAQDFLASIKLSFPLPLPTLAVCKILAFKVPFPFHDEWTKIVKEDYSREDYLHDSGTILIQRLMAKTPTEAVKRLIKSSRRNHGLWPLGLQDQAAYAKCILSTWEQNKVRLEEFYNIKMDAVNFVSEIEEAIRMLEYKSRLFTPIYKSAKARKVEVDSFAVGIKRFTEERSDGVNRLVEPETNKKGKNRKQRVDFSF